MSEHKMVQKKAIVLTFELICRLKNLDFYILRFKAWVRCSGCANSHRARCCISRQKKHIPQNHHTAYLDRNRIG
jgi:hypothetical protein